MREYGKPAVGLWNDIATQLSSSMNRPYSTVSRHGNRTWARRIKPDNHTPNAYVIDIASIVVGLIATVYITSALTPLWDKPLLIFILTASIIAGAAYYFLHPHAVHFDEAVVNRIAHVQRTNNPSSLPALTRRLYYGAVGEDLTAQQLRTLTNDFEVAHSVTIIDRLTNTSVSDIDHLVGTPTGMWVVDSKFWSGVTGQENNTLTVSGTTPNSVHYRRKALTTALNNEAHIAPQTRGVIISLSGGRLDRRCWIHEDIPAMAMAVNNKIIYICEVNHLASFIESIDDIDAGEFLNSNVRAAIKASPDLRL